MEIIYDGNSTLKLHYLSGCNILGAVGDENSNKGKSVPFENERMNGRYIILSQVVVIIIPSSFIIMISIAIDHMLNPGPSILGNLNNGK